MNILAIDTTTKKAQVGIKKNDEIFLNEIDNEITHSEKLLPLVDDTLNKASLSLKDIDMYSCVLGPGSFTGVRIAIATIKALAKVTNKEVFGITSLKLLALDAAKNLKPNTYVLSLIDAKHERAYFELFKYENNGLKEQDFFGNDLVCNIEEKLKEMHLENLVIATDNIHAHSLLLLDNTYNMLPCSLKIENILDFDTPNSNYLNLDAVYYRKSEAERTKFGE